MVYLTLGRGARLFSRGDSREIRSHDDNEKISTDQDSQRDGVRGRKFSKAKSIAERLGVCSQTVFRWADGGKITRHKINARVVLFDEVEVIALGDSNRVD